MLAVVLKGLDAKTNWLIDKNSSPPLLSRTQLLTTSPHLRADLAIVGEEPAPAGTSNQNSPFPLTPRHPRDKEGGQCNISEGIQVHGEGEQQRERMGRLLQVTSIIRA
jgi:hypothetical protein